MRGTIWIVVVVIAVGAIGFGAVSLAADDASEVRTVENESHVLDAQDPVTLDAADEWDSMYHNETVTDDNGSVLDRGTDYSIDYSTGEVLAENNDTDGESVLIDYAYDWTDATSGGAESVLGSVISPLFGLLALAAAIGVLVDWMGLM